MWKEFLSLVWALAVIAGVLALAWWFTRYVVGRRARTRTAGRSLELIEELPLGKDQKLLLVRVGEQVQLFGAAPGGIARLGALSPEEADRLIRDREQSGGGPGMPFSEALLQVLRQRKK